MKHMRVALVHDYLKEYGGAERVLEALHEVYPDATVFTSVYLPQYLGPHRERFKDWNIKTSLLQHIPLKQKLISPIRLLTPAAFKQWDFSEFDIIIVSATGAYFPNLIKKKNAVQICYCHTPPRYLYGYATARDWKKNKAIAVAVGAANHVLRLVDFDASKHVDHYIANSQEVAARIKKFYRREATVIYPPVDVSFPRRRESSEKKNASLSDLDPPQADDKREYFLTGGRLARAKHVDVIVKACSELGVPLKVFGKGFAGYGDELKKLAGRTVEFVGEVSDEEKYELMRGAKAFLFASEDEDFGIVPVEAMACGTPVIAFRSGGVKETVVDGKTGVFFEELTSGSLVQAIKKFETLRQAQGKKIIEDCRNQAEKFSKERFQKQIKAFVEAHLK